MVHDVIANEADLWEWTQDLLTREVERLVTEPDSTADDAVMAVVTSLLAQPQLRALGLYADWTGGTVVFELTQ